jgi:hypothetical protein
LQYCTKHAHGRRFTEMLGSTISGLDRSRNALRTR